MSAPSGTVWGDIVNSLGRLGIYTSASSTDTQTTVRIEVWFWSKWSVQDTNNAYYFDGSATTATTSRGSVSINHTVATGDGWSTSNQTLLGSYSYTYPRYTHAQTAYYAAKLASVEAVGGTMYAIGSCPIPALASYTVSYNANGGSGAPINQSKFYGVNLTLSTAKPTRTGYTFAGWATSASGSVVYSAGSVYTANAGVTLYAVWTANKYSVKYDANGGTGAPAEQTKTHDVDLTLSSVIPSRANYIFKGWGIASASTTVSYSAGSTYKNNAAITLYAIWELGYTKPIINNLAIERCNLAGDTSDNGTYFKVAFDWFVDSNYEGSLINVKWDSNNTYVRQISGTSGSVDVILGSGEISIEYSYDITIIVTDTNGGSTTTHGTVTAFSFPIDFLAGGKGVAFGKPATKTKFECAWEAIFEKALTAAGFEVTGTTPYIDFHYLNDTGNYTHRFIADNADRMNLTTGLNITGDFTINNETFLNLVYPINSIYISYSHESPAALFGGSWTRLSNTFLWGCDSSGVIGQTGGEQNVTLSIDEIPTHQHFLANYNSSGTTASFSSYAVMSPGTVGYSGNVRTSYSGGGAAHNNMPPYTQVSIWRRIA